MMLIPRTEYSSKTLVFGTPPYIRLWGRSVALAAAASAAALLLFFEINSPKREVILGVLAIIFVGALCAALWDEVLNLNLDSGSFEYTRGFFPFRKLFAGASDGIEEVSIASKRTNN